MKRGKEVRDSKGQPTGSEAPKEVPVLIFVMVEKGLGPSRCASCEMKTC
jgi:hypothetical protein